MNNEPVAYRYFDKDIGWLYHDWKDGFTAKGVIPLYTHPAKEQYKFGVDWSKDSNAVTVLKICEDGVAEVVFMDYQEVTHPAKTLTDEEIHECWERFMGTDDYTRIDIARAILRKVQKK
jgi:hypothetical protein